MKNTYFSETKRNQILKVMDSFKTDKGESIVLKESGQKATIVLRSPVPVQSAKGFTIYYRLADQLRTKLHEIHPCYVGKVDNSVEFAGFEINFH